MATKDALRPERIVADQRSLLRMAIDAARSPSIRGTYYIALAIAFFAAPLWTPLWLIIALPIITVDRSLDLPLRMPMEADTIDPSDPKPGRSGFNKARGAVYLGNEIGSGKEAWVSWSDQRYHDYVMGATGSGKTETILAINANYVLAGSGFIMGDGKGTMMFPKQTATLARLGGADDDHFVISFLSGYNRYSSQSYTQSIKKSNSLNPFGEGNADTVKELLTSLMSDGGGDNKIFSDGAASLAVSMAPAWVEGRDAGLFNLDVMHIGKSLALQAVFEQSQDQRLSTFSRLNITKYLANAGYDFTSPPSKQPENCTRMHGYYVNYFMRIVTSFAISYRHIYVCRQGEVNMRDIVRSRRCLTFTLPPLEKSPDEVSNLGKTLLVAARSAAAFGLGETMEGSREETIDKLPANWRVPMKFNFDEFSFYVLEGFSLLPAQLRGIAISCLLGAQDFIGTERAGKIDAESIFANARTKFFGALEDSSTWEKLRAIIGEVDMAVYHKLVRTSSILGRYIPDMELSLTRRCPIEIRDLQDQVEGEFRTFQRGRLRAIKVFYPMINEDTVLDDFYLQRLIEVFPADGEELDAIRQQHTLKMQLTEERETPLAPTPLDGYTPDSATTTSAQHAIGLMLHYATHINRPSTQAAPAAGDAADATHTAEYPVDDHLASEVPIYSEADREAQIAANEAAVDEWASTIVEDDADIYGATQQEAVRFYVEKPPVSQYTEGVLTLGEDELTTIEQRYMSLSILLGHSEEEAKQSSHQIVEDIRRAVYYLIPPKPQAMPEGAIRKCVEDIFQQASLFGEDGEESEA